MLAEVAEVDEDKLENVDYVVPTRISSLEVCEQSPIVVSRLSDNGFNKRQYFPGREGPFEPLLGPMIRGQKADLSEKRHFSIYSVSCAQNAGFF